MDEIAALIHALQRLGTPVPKDIKERLTAESVPWQIKTLFTE
jgi:hypothetical protein